MAAQGQAYQIPFTGLTGFVYAGDVAEILCQAMLEDFQGAPVINMPSITATVDDFILEIQNQMPSFLRKVPRFPYLEKFQLNSRGP